MDWFFFILCRLCLDIDENSIVFANAPREKKKERKGKGSLGTLTVDESKWYLYTM